MQIQKSLFGSFTKMTLICIFTLLVSACTHNSQKHQESVQESKPSETLPSYAWHDGSTGGAYGIGEGWIFEVLDAEYKDVVEPRFFTPPKKLVIIPAEYEWVKGTVNGPNVIESPRIELAVIPPGPLETVRETYVKKPTKPKYSLLPPEYSADGKLVRKAAIVEHEFITQTATKEYRLLTRSERIQRLHIKFEPREGYTLLETKPAEIKEIPRPQQDTTIPKWEEVQPMRVVIINPSGDTVHIFNNYDFFPFLRSFD